MVIRGLFFFQGPIGRDIETTVKIRNILFATFSHTYQLLLYIVDALTYTFFVAYYQLSSNRRQPPRRSTNSLRRSAVHCAKILSSYGSFIRGKRWKSQGAKSGRLMVVDQTLPIENTAGASLLQLQCAAEDLSWRRTVPEDNIPCCFFWIKESNYSMHSTYGRRLYCFSHVCGLTTQSELTSVMCHY